MCAFIVWPLQPLSYLCTSLLPANPFPTVTRIVAAAFALLLYFETSCPGGTWIPLQFKQVLNLFWFSCLSFLRNWEGRPIPPGLAQSVAVLGLQLLQLVCVTGLRSTMLWKGTPRVGVHAEPFCRTDQELWDLDSLPSSCLRHCLAFSQSR